MAFLRGLRLIATVLLLAAGVVMLWVVVAGGLPPPTKTFDLGAPTGRSTGAALGRLRAEPGTCRTLLTRAGVAYRALPALTAGASCGYDDGVGWSRGGAREARYAPAAPALSCPLAATLAVWEWDVVQPAAVRAFGTTVVRIDHFGSYACRRIYGRATGDWSEHARAEAIDIAGFRLADGRRITVAGDWNGDNARARFLHAVRDGACRLFATTLSPDYNAAHRDHLHLDQAVRSGWRACR